MKNKIRWIFGALMLAVLLAPIIVTAAEFKSWRSAGSDSIVDLRHNSRNFIYCASGSNSTIRMIVDSSGNLNVSGNIIAAGTITPNSGLGVTSAKSFYVSFISDHTGLVTARGGVTLTPMSVLLARTFFATVSNFSGAMAVNADITGTGAVNAEHFASTDDAFIADDFVLGDASTLSGRVDALGVLVASSIATFKKDVQGSAKATWATLAIGQDLTAGSAIISGSGQIGTSIMIGTTTTSSGRVLALDGLTASTAATFVGPIQGRAVTSTALASFATLAVTCTDAVSNLNADQVDGVHGTNLLKLDGTNSEAAGVMFFGSATVHSGAVSARTNATFYGPVIVAPGATLTAATATISKQFKWQLQATTVGAGSVVALTAAQVAGGWIKLANDSSATLTAASATGNAGARVLLSCTTDATGCTVVIENGLGALGASYDLATFGVVGGCMEVYCDGTNYWAISTRDVTIN